ncbi:MAG TPA: type II secretion system F family protein [Candidatus Binataceae bacterium]|nr:type II secretion system F family protein [Candidatus Binataceae bacterium]
MTAFVASFCFFLLLYASAAALYAIRMGNNSAIAERFANLANENRASRQASGGKLQNLSSQLSRWLMSRLPKPGLHTPRAIKMNQALAQAGYRKSDSFYRVHFLTIILPIVGGVAGFAVTAIAFPDRFNPILAALLCAAAGFLMPTYYVRYKARKRRLAISGQLSDALDLLVVSVEAGLGLSEAIKVVGEEAERQKQEIGREFSLVAADMSAGATMGEALRALAQRTAVDDMRPLAATLIQSEQLGSRIGPALRASSDTLRERRRLRAEEAAHKMTIKMIFPLGMLVLPAMIMLSAGPALIQVFRVLGH